ncbi:MAG: hypothetical protein WAM60_25615, partial [Candidatus Promineifilaceae bacterium]
MKKLFVISMLLIVSILLIGCTADSLETADVEAAVPVVSERPTQETAESEALPDFPLKSCPVTQRPEEAFVPPDPYGKSPSPGYFFYGTNALWTSIPNNQTWDALPYNPETGFTQKVFIQRAGYNWMGEPEPALTVTGRRLDAEAPPLIASRATNGFT